MAFADKKGIVVASPFKLQAESLLDVRQQVDTITERNELVTIKAATAGLRVYVKETKKSYVYNGTSWDELSVGNASLIVKLNGGTSEGTNMFTYNGTTNKTINITAAGIGAAGKTHTHTKSEITDFPTSLKNPQALKFTGAATASYDGSAAVTVTIPTTSKTTKSLIVTLNGGTTEGTNKFTFDGSAEKTINITPSTIGAAAATHTHDKSQITGLTTGRVLISDANGHPAVSAVTSTELGYLDGVTSNIQTQLNGKATSNHTHNYAGSSSAGGSANSAVKLVTARKINGTSFDGTRDINVLNNYFASLTDEDLNAYRTYGEYYAAGGNTCANKPTGVDGFYLKIFRNASGYTAQELYNGTWYSRYYNGTAWTSWSEQYSSTNKPSASDIGAAPTSHTHTKSQITDFPTSMKNPYSLTFSGAVTGTYDGSRAVTINIPTTGATTKSSLTIQLNGGTTEGTNKFTFNGGTAKTINITPASIGAAAASHGTHVTYGATAPKANGTASAGTANSVSRSDHVHPLQTTVSGNAGSATKLATARSIRTNLASTTAASFDGTADVTPGITGTLPISHGGTGATTAMAANYNILKDTPAITDGWSDDTAIAFISASPNTTQGALRKYKAIDMWNDWLNAKVNTSYAPKSHGTHVTYGTSAPKANGTASAGSASSVSRSDHVHPAQTTVSGNAGSATKLATARTIDGVSFNGTANITHYGTCSTAASTAAKVVSCTGFALATGAKITVKFTVTNTASNPTLNVNSTGAKAIQYRGSAISSGYLATNRVYTFIYDGTNYQLIGDINTDTNTTYSTGTATTAGLTRLYTSTGSATNGTMTQKAITDALAGKSSSSHTHNYAGSSSAGGAANSANKINGIALTNQSLNDYHNGVNFYYGAGGNTCTNKPPGVDNFGMFVFQSAGGWWTQILYGSDDDMYTRRYGGSTWTAWSKIYSTTNKPTASDIGAASSSHTHNYAGSSSAGGAANSAVKLTTARTINGTSFDGTKNITLNAMYAEDLSNKNVSLNTYNLSSGNPKIKYYFCPSDGAGDGITGRPDDNKKNAFFLICESIRFASATDYITKQTYIHGLSKTTWERYCTNGTWSAWGEIYTSQNKPTASEIGAASSSHTHNYAGSSSAGGAANSVKSALTIQFNGTTKATFNGSAAATVNITPSAIGAAAASHTHNYAGSSSAGGAANSANKVPVPVGTVLFATSSTTTFFNACFGGTWEIVGNIDAIYGSSNLTLYMFRKTAA